MCLKAQFLGPLLSYKIKLYATTQAVDSELLLSADDTCLICGKDTKATENQLNKQFNSPCNWFIDNKLSILFGEEKAECIFSVPNDTLKTKTLVTQNRLRCHSLPRKLASKLLRISDSRIESKGKRPLSLLFRRVSFLKNESSFSVFSSRLF